MRGALGNADRELFTALDTSEEAAGSSLNDLAPGSRATGGVAPGSSPGGQGAPRAGAKTGAATPSPAGGASARALGAGNSGASSSPAGAGPPPAPSPPPTLVERLRESAPVQGALGAAYGALQSLTPGGFLAPSPAPRSRAFETGRGLAQVAVGIGQVLTGGGMMGGGGAATVAGGAGALPSGGTSLVLSGAGVAVAAEGAVVAATGVTNVGAGIHTITNAVTMSGSSSSGPPAGAPTPAPAPGATPASPPPPGPAATPPAPPAPAAPIPPKATSVLNQVKASNGSAPSGYRGGGPFANDGRGNGQVLPRSDAAGKPITYREYDVNPFQPGVNRGAERIVVGSDGKAYYTNDHYRTFTPIP